MAKDQAIKYFKAPGGKEVTLVLNPKYMPARARKLEQDEVVVSENEDGIDITANVDNPTPDPSNYGPK